ncbi:MAG: tetratricopeptide repeat protein [Planctomycetes bacterium]|nr:tetratricopeptide repeat protein [Planctomycetota bacterium]
MNADRIANFERMAQADPTNEMAHFSLGNAYLQAGRHAEAAASLERCLELAPEMSKAWQLCGQAQLGAGWADKAVQTLNRGYEIAAGKGDRMPQQAIAELLRGVGREPPTVAVATAAGPAGGTGDGFVCSRTGRAGTRMDAAPFRGPVGAWIHQNISAETWKAWIGQGTKVINELRLDFSRDRDQEVYDQHMHEFLGLDPEMLARLKGGTEPARGA